MYIAKAYIERAQLDKAIQRVRGLLGSDVVNVRYSLEEDWTGDPAVFFRVVLADRASRPDRLRSSTRGVEGEIERRLKPREQWGVIPYFEYRSQSEQAKLRDPEWE